MSDDMRVNDEQLDAGDVRQLENADEVAHFFAKLRYDIDERTNIPDYTLLGLGSEDLRQRVHRIELIGKDPEDGDISIYLFEVKSVTAKLRNDIARGFRQLSENALLVLTKDYEELEFVLLERSISPTKSRRVGVKQAIRPIPLTINRLHPDLVALRVLKRFTFTEADAAYQWEKLRSAYMLAEWSEEYFNNRALFSDYYLKERLTDSKITSEWDEDVRPVGRQVFKRMTNAREDYTRQPESIICRDLYEPVFALLGFRSEGQKSTSDRTKADYLLYDPDNMSKPIAAALTTVWNRNLDDVDESREPDQDDGGTPNEIPGATVVTLLEKQIAPWVIVTNGKLWRLYAAAASNKATNYYEVDLEEAFAANDQITALKYWWLLFRREAFTGFLDALLKNSADYAKELGDRLKERVFVEIFPQFARGFIADMRTRGAEHFDEVALEQVYSGTLTFLYRLMFVLYAESLELLPMNDVRGYRGSSLYRIKNEIADVGGTILDEAPKKLDKKYTTNATDLYQRLTKLFGIIDHGSDELNIPTYNGGLFSQETESGRFLAQYAIPDYYLVRGLDLLARDIDKRTQALVFIDFKSLGVRQLGSIYEGLLEFKVKIATEQLAVTKEKKKEVYKPVAQAKKPLALIEVGGVYLENDKRERKATGSYYTPDYIVKYIVQHTVGPVLDRKFEELAPRLREAQKGYRSHIKTAEARTKAAAPHRSTVEDPRKYWNSESMRYLVDDCLNVRVLDPAMGSGHFLVEVVDYVSNRLIDFLNGWSENPVWAMIDRTREDILSEMEQQKVTIDADRLTRVALLKRAVLKRCIYGVDLNAMAVELAKVSLWLDAFTLGAPLSFLDHHLKHGNSLIGARVKDVQDYLDTGAVEQMDMFSGSKFAGVMMGTDLMRQVSYQPDNTIEQSRQSAEQFRRASDELAPYKRVLDVYVSRWFSNTPSKKVKTDYVRMFLQDPQTEAWLRDPRVPLDTSLIPADRIATNALNATADKHFFHWELEFPEVFFAPSTPGGQDVQLIEDGGFDAVVGNPPYDELSEDSLGRLVDERNFLTNISTFKPTQDSSGRLNWYHYFMVLSLRLLTTHGKNGLIVPMSWMGDSFTLGVRKWMLEKHKPILIEAFPQKDNPFERIFFDAKLPTSVFIAEKNRNNGKIAIRVHPGKRILETPHFDADLNTIYYLSPENLLIPLVDSSGWKILKTLVSSSQIGRWNELAADPTSGEIIFNTATHPYMSRQEKLGYQLILRGSHVQRYEMVEEAKQGQPEYLNVSAYLQNSHEDSKAYAYKNERIVYQEGSAIDAWRRVIPAYLPAGHICGHKICYFVNYKIGKMALLAVFASNFVNWLVEKLSVTNSLPAYLIGNLPFPHINFTTPVDERERLVREAVGAYELGDGAGVLQRVQTALDSDQSDVVHDLLAHLAQLMMDLNKAKQMEVKRFLGWVAEHLHIRPDKSGAADINSLKGKSIIQNYLGDYQKGEGELPWRDFHFRLHENRNRFAVSLSDVEGEIEREYEASLVTLLPVKQDLARTDALIDKIVYRLYGLTDEEIELIERPQYEQALADAKKQVVDDTKIKDDEEKLSKMADGMLPAAKRFFERIEPQKIEAALDEEIPAWRTLPPEAPTFLLTGDYNLSAMPDHMDFSSSIIPYTKAVEVVLHERIFAPFRTNHTDADCRNNFLKLFMRGEKHLTLGSYMIILQSSKETALRDFIDTILADLDGFVKLLNDDTMRVLRNRAAHSEVLDRAGAQEIRTWAMDVLRLM